MRLRTERAEPDCRVIVQSVLPLGAGACLIVILCYPLYNIFMEKLSERLNKPLQKRRYRFITDHESESNDSPNSLSSSSREKEINKNKVKVETRAASKLKEYLRRNYKFLTET